MFILYLSFILLLNTNAYSLCPKIEGQFKCNNQGDLLELNIHFKKTEGASIYFINEDKVIADAKSRFYEDENVKNGKLSGTCVDNSLSHHLRGFFENSKGETYGRVNLISMFKHSKNGELEIVQSGEYVFDSYGEITIDNIIKCLKP